MEPITRTHDELFGTAVMAARLGRADAIVSRLRRRYEEDDDTAGLPYALAMLAQLQAGDPDKLDYTEVVETLSDLLYYQPDHWLGRYLRVHTRSLLPVESDEHVGYLNAERARAVEDIAELLERQAGTDWQPWFACSYLLAARLTWQFGDRGEVAGLIETAAARPATPIPFPALTGLLCQGFVWYGSQPELPAQADANALMGQLFPALAGAGRVPQSQPL